MSKIQELQKLIRLYREETGKSELDMHEVALFCFRKGWPFPTPKSPADMLAAMLRDAARQDVRTDKASGRPYRAYHAVPAASRNMAASISAGLFGVGKGQPFLKQNKATSCMSNSDLPVSSR